MVEFELPGKWVSLVQKRVEAKIRKFLPEWRPLTVSRANEEDYWLTVELDVDEKYGERDVAAGEARINLRKLRGQHRNTVTDDEAKKLARKLFRAVKKDERKIDEDLKKEREFDAAIRESKD
jgi:hypothetical protein